MGSDASVVDFSLLPKGVKVAMDIKRNGSPLMGVYSGLIHLRSEYAVVLPCDSPFINTYMLRYLVGGAEGADAVVPRWPNGYIESLHSVYKVACTLKASDVAMNEGDFRIYNMIVKLKRMVYVSVEELRKIDPERLTFFNINSAKDLRVAETILKRISGK